MKNSIVQQCSNAYVKKNLRISKKGIPYFINSKGKKINCKYELVCFIKIPFSKKKKKIKQK